MCGIFGFVGQPDKILTVRQTQKLTKLLFKLSESRGKEAAGLALMEKEKIALIKKAAPASVLIKSQDYEKIWQNFSRENFESLIGHARLVTNGSMSYHVNNQPVNKNGVILVHNGIVVNDQDLWSQFPDLNREAEVDTEIIAALIKKFIDQTNSLALALQKTFSLIKGACSLAGLINDQNEVFLATNNGSLYYLSNTANNFFIFASEKHILEKISQHWHFKRQFSAQKINQLPPGEILIFNIITGQTLRMNLKNILPESISQKTISRPIIEINKEISVTPVVKEPPPPIDSELILKLNEYYLKIKSKVDGLKRCTKCILPETMPLIEFDEHGVCNYCRHYQPIKNLGFEKLKQAVAPYQKNNGKPDCVVTFSGGRDSSYGLHYIKKNLGLNPVAYSYDWGMITDLARRNQSRMCGELGVEHILISANIKKKRNNIKKNVLAWLKKPNLGTIPLFMAGDKQYFYYANKISKQIKAPLIVICTNLLEKTYFKTAFCHARISFNSKKPYSLSLINQIKLILFYLKSFITNPSYLNSSLIDTLGAFISYYFISHKHLNIYQYLPWDEQEISHTLINQYNWETAPDTSTTWRIGDGTAAFYNYIYYTMAGFTENDTFRSNQIREGIMDRAEALKIAANENQPRWPAFKWYCDTIDIDWLMAIEKINNAPKLYQL